MAEIPTEMSRHAFSVAYDGSSRADEHSINVEDLAPALLAFGKLIREANSEANGKRATAKIVVVSDFEHKCFHVNFDVIISIYHQLKTLIATDDAQTAKCILEWVGLIGGGTATGIGGTLSYLEYLKWKRGRKVKEARKLTDSDGRGLVEVNVEGDGNSVHVHNHVYNLSENSRALRATRDAFLPLGHDGFDILRLRDGKETIAEIDSASVERIVASCNVGIEEAKETEPEVETTSAWLSVYSPVYDKDAPQWRFRLGKDVIYADITDTNIATDALARGGALADDAYQVRLQITIETDANGKQKSPQYKILNVIRFVPAAPVHQHSLFSNGNG